MTTDQIGTTPADPTARPAIARVSPGLYPAPLNAAASTPEEDAHAALVAKKKGRNNVLRGGFYGVCLAVALAGQVTGTGEVLGWPLIAAIPAVAALELGGIVILNTAEVRRLMGEKAIQYRLLSAAVAAGSVAFNWLAHHDHLQGGFFAGMSSLGYTVWVLHTEDQRRDNEREKGHANHLVATYTLAERMAHPFVTRLATVLAQRAAEDGQSMGRHAALASARAEIARRKRRKVAAGIASEVLGEMGELAEQVVDGDRFVDVVMDHIDQDAIAVAAAGRINTRMMAAFAGTRTRRFGRTRTEDESAAGTRTRWWQRRTRTEDAAAVDTAGTRTPVAYALPGGTRTALPAGTRTAAGQAGTRTGDAAYATPAGTRTAGEARTRTQADPAGTRTGDTAYAAPGAARTADGAYASPARTRTGNTAYAGPEAARTGDTAYATPAGTRTGDAAYGDVPRTHSGAAAYADPAGTHTPKRVLAASPVSPAGPGTRTREQVWDGLSDTDQGYILAVAKVFRDWETRDPQLTCGQIRPIVSPDAVSNHLANKVRHIITDLRVASGAANVDLDGLGLNEHAE